MAKLWLILKNNTEQLHTRGSSYADSKRSYCRRLRHGATHCSKIHIVAHLAEKYRKNGILTRLDG